MRRVLKLRDCKITKLQNSSGYILITLMLFLTLLSIAAIAVLPEIATQIKRDREAITPLLFHLRGTFVPVVEVTDEINVTGSFNAFGQFERHLAFGLEKLLLEHSSPS